MTTNEAVIKRFFESFTEQRDVEAAGAVFAAEAIIHQDAMSGALNVDAYRQVGAMFLAGFSDLQATGWSHA